VHRDKKVDGKCEGVGEKCVSHVAFGIETEVRRSCGEFKCDFDGTVANYSLEYLYELFLDPVFEAIRKSEQENDQTFP